MVDQKKYIDIISKAAVIPVVKLNDPADAVPLAKALLAGGINIIEITFRTDAAAECIKLISENCPEMIVGAGTVIKKEQLLEAKKNGAVFCVSPGLNPNIVRLGLDEGMFMLPGVMTPSEIEQGLELGLALFKFFPAAQAGGTKMIKAIRGPYGNVSFVPTGGISMDNMEEYLSCPGVVAVGGSFLADSAKIKTGDYASITETAALCCKMVASFREGK